MNVQDLIYRILNSGQAPSNALASVAGQAPTNALASAGGFGVSDSNSLPANLQGGAMLDSAATGAVPQQPAMSAPQIAQGAPVASGGPNMGIGNAIQSLFMPQRSGRNQTVGWLMSQGLDEGTATLLAGNKQALQQYLLKRTQGGAPEYDFMNIDGTLVRTDKRSGKIQPLGQFGSQDEGYTLLTPEEITAAGLPPGTYQKNSEGKIEVVGGIRDQDAGLSREQGLRKEYVARPEYKRFDEVQASYERVRSAAQRNTGAGDVGLIFGFMKMLDPGSVVREGEFATAQNTAGIPERVRTLYNQAIAGERLSPEQRAEFVNLANDLYEQEAQRLRGVNEIFTGISSQYGIDPANVIIQPRKFEPLAPPEGNGLPLPPTAPSSPTPPTTSAPAAPVAPSTPQSPDGVIDWKDFIAPGRKR